MFISFFVEAIFETFFNMFVCFAAYGFLQIVYPASDYKKRSIWIKRSVVFTALAGALMLVYYFVWERNRSAYIIESGSFADYEIYIMGVLLSEMMLIMMTLNEAMSLFTNELPKTSKIDNQRRFIDGYRANMLNAAVKSALLCACALTYVKAYKYLAAEYAEHLAGSNLIFSNALYYVFAGVIAFVIIVKAVYLTVEYLRRKYGKAAR